MTLKNDAKFEEKLTCALENDMRNIANFNQKTWKSQKLGLWWDAFIQSRKCMSLKFAEELCVMVMKNDAKFDKELTHRWKLTWEIWLKHSKVTKIWTLIGSFWKRSRMFELKNYRRVMFDGTGTDWCKIWKKTDLCFPKWHEKFDKFLQAEK